MKKTVILLVCVSVFLGCAQTKPILVTESDIETPYEKLGELQVKAKVYKLTLLSPLQLPMQWLGRGLTFNLVKPAPQVARLKKKIDKKLRKIAKRRYKADAVINVRYWPDLDSASFPKGYVYGQGDIIEYKKVFQK